MRRTTWGVAAWNEAFRRFDQSGMTVAKFCEAEGCAVATFYAWRKRLARRQPVDFTELIVEQQPESNIEIELPGSVRIKLLGRVDPRELRVVLDCLEQRSC